ncbi:MAG: TOBE domain-containing protein, partial [Fibrobacterota bacterium]
PAADGDRMILEGDGLRLSIEALKEETLKKYSGEKIVVGIRPDHISIYDSRLGKRRSDTKVDLNVEVVEPLGNMDVITASIKETKLTLCTPPDSGLEAGSRIEAVFDGRRLHVFDEAMHERIC